MRTRVSRIGRRLAVLGVAVALGACTATAPTPRHADAPPLDWRMTPRNIALQILAILAFIAVVWFMATLMFDGVASVFSFVTGG